MNDAKERTWPASVCRDPSGRDLWNVRAIDGFCVFNPGLEVKAVAQQACDGINEHFDIGRQS